MYEYFKVQEVLAVTNVTAPLHALKHTPAPLQRFISRTGNSEKMSFGGYWSTTDDIANLRAL